MNEISIARVKETFEQWAMYDAVIRHDYMHHAELIANLRCWAENVPGARRIVDLGCGDAWLATKAFGDIDVTDYLGIDVSESAARHATRNLACWPGRSRVACANLAEAVTRLESDSANVVLASFSLHHFSSDEKQRIVAQCSRVLTRGGSLLWIDAVRDENVTRDEWVGRVAEVINREWTGLTANERANGSAHVLEADFPETAGRMEAMCAEVGLRRDACVLDRPFFRGWAFMK